MPERKTYSRARRIWRFIAGKMTVQRVEGHYVTWVVWEGLYKSTFKQKPQEVRKQTVWVLEREFLTK